MNLLFCIGKIEQPLCLTVGEDPTPYVTLALWAVQQVSSVSGLSAGSLLETDKHDKEGNTLATIKHSLCQYKRYKHQLYVVRHSLLLNVHWNIGPLALILSG